jgi:hypothetical protein
MHLGAGGTDRLGLRGLGWKAPAKSGEPRLHPRGEVAIAKTGRGPPEERLLLRT